MVSFDHRDPGTPETVWAEAFAARDIPAADEGVDRLVVVAAHPDDESLGAAGTIARAVARGIPVDVLVVTDGEGSHPESPSVTPASLALWRRDELTTAMARLGLLTPPTFLGLPDGGTDGHRDAIATALTAVLAAASADERVLVVSPWRGDGHRDHRVVGEIAEEVGARAGARVRAYPIWLWHWGTPADVPWDRMEAVALDDAARAAKARALDAHVSQTHPLSAAAGDEALLHPGMQAHFARAVELLIAPEPPRPVVGEAEADARVTSGSMDAAYFDGMYERHDDPWGFDSRWYEERKRRIVTATLPRERYDAAFEAGCSTGALTVELAARCDRVLAVDLAEAAVDRARDRLAGRAGVEIRRAALPAEWPDGVFDLIVLSEVAYYWGDADLDRALTACVGSLRPGGHLVACHWRHPVAEYPRTGDDVHAALAAHPGLRRLVRHEEEDFVLEVFGAPGAGSVAREGGLLP
ncbi:PIG-L family deacetylase [Microbacterium sp. HMH0099]|uniref:PIG-L family deacetylase n=1 Tax=Microbacterium sp. HMH0099 TaxID=3414026 RepID=UPI003BF696FC